MSWVLRGCACVLASLCLSSTVRTQSLVSPELLELQGTWLVTAAERAGSPLAEVQGAKLTFGESSFELRAGLSEIRGRIHVRAHLSPKQIDFQLRDGTIWLGIYTVTAKSLRVSFVKATATSQRPELFATSTEAPATLLVTERER